VLCQTAQKIVATYDGFGIGNDSGELVTKYKLQTWSRAGLIDTVFHGGEWHYLLYVPTRAVWTDLPEYFDSAIIDISGNILTKDLLVYELPTMEAIIPDSLYYEEWTFSEKAVRKFRKKKQNNNDFIYHNLSNGFKPAKHKSDLNDKAKEAKEKKEKKNG